MRKMMRQFYLMLVCLLVFDPVALDQACADACNAQTPMPNSLLNDHMHEEGFHDHHDHFTNTTPETNWKGMLGTCGKDWFRYKRI